jgi:Calpain family cysteine protease
MFATSKKRRLSKNKPSSRPTFKPQFEALEERTLMSATALMSAASLNRTASDLTAATPLNWTAPVDSLNAIVLTMGSGQMIDVLDNGALVASQSALTTSSITLTGSTTALNTFSILMTPSGVPTTINLVTSSDRVVVGDSNGVQDILGSLTINGTPSENALTLNDTGDSGSRAASISPTSVTGLAPAPIYFSSNMSLQVTGQSGDAAYLVGPTSGVNTLAGTPGGATLSGLGYALSVSHFSDIAVTSESTGDVADLDSAPYNDNTFTAQAGDCSISNANGLTQAIGFSSVYAYSESSNDVANLDGAGGASTLVVNASSATLSSEATLSGSGYFVEATGFGHVTSEGLEAAYIHGSGSFIATPQQATANLGNTTVQLSNYGSVYEYLTSSTFELTSSGILNEDVELLNLSAMAVAVNPGDPGGPGGRTNYWTQVDSDVSTVAVGQLVSTDYVWDLSGTGAHQFNGTSAAANSDVALFNELVDPQVRSTVFELAVQDGVLGYSEMLQVYAAIESDGAMSRASFADLQTLAAQGSCLGMSAAVQDLAGKVVNGDAGNSVYQFANAQGTVTTLALGDLTATSSAAQLTELVNKWFLGMNDPLVASGVTYKDVWWAPLTDASSGSFNYYDVAQGDVGNCWLMASLAEVAVREPSVLQSMFTYEGSYINAGLPVYVYAVRLYHIGSDQPYYVTVNTDLPDSGTYYARVMHDNPNLTVSEDLWVALAEKAYAQANGSGAVLSSHNDVDSYAALTSGQPTWALWGITGTEGGLISVSPSDVAKDWQGGDLIVLCTPTGLSSSQIVGDHCYAMIGYNPSSSSPFELFNPWGLKGPADEYKQLDQFWASSRTLASNFDSMGYVGSALDQLDPGTNAVPPRRTDAPQLRVSNYQPAFDEYWMVQRDELGGASASNMSDAGAAAQISSKGWELSFEALASAEF